MVLLNLLVEASTIKVTLGQKRVRSPTLIFEFRIKNSMGLTPAFAAWVNWRLFLPRSAKKVTVYPSPTRCTCVRPAWA